MLRFIQRYQKSMITAFGVLTSLAMITSSLKMFNNNRAAPAAPRSTLAVDSSEQPSRATFDALYRLLSHEASLDSGANPWCRPNELNKGVVTGYIIELGLGDLIAERASERVQQQWQTILERQRDWCKQRHTDEMVAVLKLEAPELLLAPPQQQSLNAKEFIETQHKGYLLSQKIPTSALMLWLQKVQSGHARFEQGFDTERVRLFGARTLVDWYGEEFLRQCTGFILSAASRAKALGLTVSRSEILEDWRQQLKDSDQPAALLDRQIESILKARHIPRAYAEDAWAQVLLFQKWLAHECDTLIKQHEGLKERVAQAVADFEAKTQVRCLKGRIELPTLLDLVAYETYLSCVADRRGNLIAIPSQLLAIDKIERRAPELLTQSMVISYRSVDLNAIRNKIPFTAVVQWQKSDEGWVQLCQRCRSLFNKENETDRGHFLEALPASEEALADQLARDALMQNRNEWVARAWSRAALKEETCRVCLCGNHRPLDQGPPGPQYLAWADGATLPKEIGGKRWRYRLESVRKVGTPEPLTYIEAIENGNLELLVNRILASDYELMRQGGIPQLWNHEKLQSQEAMEPFLLEQRLTGIVSAMQAATAELGITMPDDKNQWGALRLALALREPITEPFLAQQFHPEETFEKVATHCYPMIAKLRSGEWSIPLARTGKAEIMQVREQIQGRPRVDSSHPATHQCLKRLLKERVESFLKELSCN